jgi:large subunit ribosomal protein L22
MDVTALTKYTRISPKKARDVANELVGLPANEGLELLKFIPRKAARLLYKTLQSAIANAENNHNLSSDDLIIRSAIVEEGPAMKRFKPAARGSAHPIRKRTSHLRIVLTEKAAEPANA